MSKEQIEEMANDIEKSHWKIVQDFMGCHINSEEMAEHLYNAGYRKQSEGIANNATTTGEWISVEERLPNEFVSVLGYMTDAEDFPSVRECYLVGRVFLFPSLHEIHPVSHWMPLPEPPKMKGGAE